jgi:hypothetical protein
MESIHPSEEVVQQSYKVLAAMHQLQCVVGLFRGYDCLDRKSWLQHPVQRLYNLEDALSQCEHFFCTLKRAYRKLEVGC